jgi:hypothetical protein
MHRATKHTCGGPVFGRKTPGCPRCDELLAGAAPVVQAWRGQRERDGRARSEAVHAHFRSARHNNPSDPNWCGRVCTFGEW